MAVYKTWVESRLQSGVDLKYTKNSVNFEQYFLF